VTLFELLLLGLAMTGLVGMGIVLGAMIIWRLVHRVAMPPPLPLWLSILALSSVLLVAIPIAAAGQWLPALLAAASIGFQFMAHAYEAVRRRRRSTP
jgi:hypothetical protein